MGNNPIIIPLSLLLLILSAISQISSAQDSPHDYVNGHNAARAEVGVPPIKWNKTVASFARNYVNSLKDNCGIFNSGGPYGENLFWIIANLTGKEVVELWASEKPFYDYNSNSCGDLYCWDYTQMVWRDSVRLGCAKVKCSNDLGTLISCNYDPPGNIKGQRPY